MSQKRLAVAEQASTRTLPSVSRSRHLVVSWAPARAIATPRRVRRSRRTSLLHNVWTTSSILGFLGWWRGSGSPLGGRGTAPVAEMCVGADEGADVAEKKALQLRTLQSLMQSLESKIGGGEGVDGLYGTITMAGFQQVLDDWTSHCGLGADSMVVDVGAGVGRPLLHAWVARGCKTVGYEVDNVKCMKGEHMVSVMLEKLGERGMLPSKLTPPPHIMCTPIEKVATLDPATHAYAFWEGMPPSAKEAFGRLFTSSSTLQSVAVVQRRVHDILAHMKSSGFEDIELLSDTPVKMAGSGQTFRAYLFQRRRRRTSLRLSGISSAPCELLARVEGPLPAALSSVLVPMKEETGTQETEMNDAGDDPTPQSTPAKGSQARPRTAAADASMQRFALVTKSGRVSKPNKLKDGEVARQAVRRGISADLIPGG